MCTYWRYDAVQLFATFLPRFDCPQLLMLCGAYCSASGAVFTYIEDSLEVSRLEAAAAQEAFKAAVLQSMGRLVEADAPEAASLVLAHFPDDHAAIVSSLEPTPELQYEYLKARMPASHAIFAK
jgi:hypothetical protein